MPGGPIALWMILAALVVVAAGSITGTTIRRRALAIERARAAALPEADDPHALERTADRAERGRRLRARGAPALPGRAAAARSPPRARVPAVADHRRGRARDQGAGVRGGRRAASTRSPTAGGRRCARTPRRRSAAGGTCSPRRSRDEQAAPQAHRGALRPRDRRRHRRPERDRDRRRRAGAEPRGPALVLVRDLTGGDRRLGGAGASLRASTCACCASAPSDASLPSDGTVVLLDPEDFTRGQARALRRFAERGGRVVAGGLDPGAWLRGLGAPPAWDNGASQDARVVVPSRATGAAAADPHGRRGPLEGRPRRAATRRGQ